jgi:tRNA U34 2-thiouridine synthase MnmA/TrmU
MTIKKKVKALGLCSGGLDSILAALVLREQGIDVLWVAFETPFFSADKARKASINNKIPIIVKDITGRYLPMLQNPHCGYGKNMNPCLDCHALMFRMAGEMMAENGCDFLFSGEVVGQRPMSQQKKSLRYVEKNSGFDGLILRPLSAKLLPETVMEQNGLVDREQLGDLSGRGRKPQMEMARKFGVTDYPLPAGGCLLTSPGYASRLQDLFEHQEDITVADLNFLAHGRHLRMEDGSKIIVGRNQKENEALFGLYRPEQDALMQVNAFSGPVTVVPGGGSEKDLLQAAAVCAGYSSAPLGAPVEVSVTLPDKVVSLTVIPIPRAGVQDLLII